MFTGIIESLATLQQVEQEGSNTHFWFSVPFVGELKVDQSVSHNGVCLTVVEIRNNRYKVTAIAETLRLTNLSTMQVGDPVNVERCMPANGRFDGHIVQGHVDGMASCIAVTEENGSHVFTFRCEHPDFSSLVVKKGSICVNGISLTVVDETADTFSVAIIPYTWEQTNLHRVHVGSRVNIEFDILGKYIAKQLGARS